MHFLLNKLVILKDYCCYLHCGCLLAHLQVIPAVILISVLSFSSSRAAVHGKESFSRSCSNTARSCSKHSQGWTSPHFLCFISQFCTGSWRADKACMQDSTIMWLAFREGTVAVWVVQDAQWTCQGGWALSNAARVWQGPDESRSYRWRPVNQGGSWRSR